MSNYTYQNGKFGNKDLLPPNDPQKIIKGQDFEEEFPDIEVAVNSKLNTVGPAFSSGLTGDSITITGTLEANLIDGGSF
jgi:hypothetical protein